MSFSDYLSDNVSTDIRHQGDNSEIMIKCPFCDDGSRDYKLYVSTDIDYSPWQCFRCGRTGNPYSFVMAYEDISFQDAKDTLELYGVEDDNIGKVKEEYGDGLEPEEYLYIMTLKEFQKNKSKDKDVVKVPPKPPVGYISLVNNHSNEAKPFRQYLTNRGVSEEQIIKHDIGYIVNGYMITSTESRATINNHVVFLTKDFNNNYQYWNTRAINNSSYVKTYNASNMEEELGKSDVIFNLNNAIHKRNIVLVEGVFDALTLGDSGIATFGKKVSDNQVKLLKTYLKEEQSLFIFLDNDGVDEANKLSNKLSRPNTYIVINKTDKDVNDLGPKRAMEMVAKSSVPADGQGALLAKLNTLV